VRLCRLTKLLTIGAQFMENVPPFVAKSYRGVVRTPGEAVSETALPRFLRAQPAKRGSWSFASSETASLKSTSAACSASSRTESVPATLRPLRPPAAPPAHPPLARLPRSPLDQGAQERGCFSDSRLPPMLAR
jgi:hypothetical protein